MSRLLQFLIALVGLGITVMLGLASMKNEQVQTKQALLGLFSNSVSVARNNCDAGLLFIAEDAVRELAKIDAAAAKLYGERLEEVDASIRGPACTAATSAAAAQVVASAPEVLSAAPMPPAADAEARDRAVVQAPAARAVQAEVQEQARQVAITSQMASRSQNLEFRKLQSKIAPDLNGSGKYYAVLASYGVGDGSTYDAQLGAAAHYNQLVSAASKTKAVVEVYRTGTGHFAIVLRPDPPTRDGARELTLLARREGWATDSFVQVARDWVQCKEPGSIEGLRACAK